MKHPALAALTATLVAGLTVIAAPLPHALAEPPARVTGVDRQTLDSGDGWGSAGSGTTGGSAADRAHVHTVTNRNELAAAVAGNEPKIVRVAGRIDANTDDHNRPLSCTDYARNGYTLAAYLAAYDPAVWGWDTEPAGPIEDARAASQKAQAARIQIPVGSNTTIIGLPGAEITGANLRINNASNVIVRGLTITDAHDCFPSWDPTDGATGNWNSEYDTVSLTGATNVWVDHNDFSDGDNPDSAQPVYFGRPYQVHDGLLDITNASDLVTVSWNRMHDHDKSMLIGSSDSRTSDAGKLRVTLHHNKFRNLGQRVPRVRYGQVDVYNNHYVVDSSATDQYVYSLGVGINSHIVAEHNVFDLAAPLTADRIIGVYKGTKLTAGDNLVNGRRTNIVAAYNAVHDPDLANVTAWSPLLRRTVHPVQAVAAQVDARAGVGGLPGGR